MQEKFELSIEELEILVSVLVAFDKKEGLFDNEKQLLDKILNYLTEVAIQKMK